MIGRLIQEAATKVARMPTSGPIHELAVGDRDDQASHRSHHWGQAADKEGVIEGWANERKRTLQQARAWRSAMGRQIRPSSITTGPSRRLGFPSVLRHFSYWPPSHSQLVKGPQVKGEGVARLVLSTAAGFLRLAMATFQAGEESTAGVGAKSVG